MKVSWEFLGVLAAVGGGILGWLLRLTSKLSFLQTEIMHLRAKYDGLDSLERKLIRLEERMNFLVSKLDEFVKKLEGRH